MSKEATDIGDGWAAATEVEEVDDDDDDDDNDDDDDDDDGGGGGMTVLLAFGWVFVICIRRMGCVGIQDNHVVTVELNLTTN